MNNEMIEPDESLKDWAEKVKNKEIAYVNEDLLPAYLFTQPEWQRHCPTCGHVYA